MGGDSLDQRFADAMGQLLGPDFPAAIGLAVSGGGDSMAMLALAHNWARVWGVTLRVVTVDHGLRRESAAEAAMVAEECASLGHAHSILTWQWDGQGNLQARARAARLALIDRWRGEVQHVLFAHTADDVAETFLLRLSRRAGVEGLAEMRRSRRVAPLHAASGRPELSEGNPDGPPSPPVSRSDGFVLHRPCLDMTCAELRHYARTLKVRWVEDPSNDDPAFDRAKMRALLPQMAAAGLSAEVLVAGARHMARAAEALRLRAAERFEVIGREGNLRGVPTGEILLDRSGFEATDRDTQLRLLSHACAYVATRSYRPREAALEAVLDRLLAGGGGTLHGCELRMERDQLRLFREFAAVCGTSVFETEGGAARLWDGRFRLRVEPGQQVRALGDDGWAQLPVSVEKAMPFHATRSLPSVWDETGLIACPALDLGEIRQTLAPMGREGLRFRQFLLSH